MRRIKTKAFTLIELLIVIAIIALMMTVLLPALASAKRKGMTVVCLSNMHQMQIAAGVYANNNSQYYPPAYGKDPNLMDTIMESASWDFCHAKNYSTGVNTIKPGLLWQGDTIDKVQQCPAFKGNPNSDDIYSGYNYNTSYIGHGPGETIKTPAKVTAVGNPSGCALFGDGQYTAGANKFMRSPIISKDDYFYARYSGTQGYRHDQRTNVMWCDGHGSSQKELFTETDTYGQKLIEEYNENKDNEVKIGFLSPNNSAYDLK